MRRRTGRGRLGVRRRGSGKDPSDTGGLSYPGDPGWPGSPDLRLGLGRK